MRIRAALHLGEQRELAALDTLIHVLTMDPDPYVRDTITWALVRIGEPALAPLMALAGHPVARTRHDAVHALSKLNYVQASLVLWERLGDEDARVVAKAAFALGRLRARGAIPELVALLGHPSSEVGSSVTEALEAIGPWAIDQLGEALTKETPRKRELAASVLGSIEAEKSVVVLARGLADPSWKVRVAVLMALSRLEYAAATTSIRKALGDTDSRVQAVARALSRPPLPQ